MNVRSLGFLALFLLGCADEEPFVSLPKFCEELASSVCEGRGRCCSVDPAACEMAEAARCAAAIMPYEQESTLRYDAVLAGKKLSAAREASNACQSPPALASFFERGLSALSACERDTQCASGRCAPESRTCVEAAPAPLCGP